MISKPIQRWLQNASPMLFSSYCIAAAFGTYFCMYAFRKPFTAATFEDTEFGGIGYKTILVAAQVFGYTISKFIGIKFVSEMKREHRAVSILGLIAIAELSLLMFAFVPAPWNAIFLFLNGLPLGMVFGLVLGFLEGRRVTEALAAGLCASFIVSSGVVKSVGRSLIEDYGFGEYQMPFVTGLVFLVPLLVCVWMLAHIPPPNSLDEHHRMPRQPMDTQRRRGFLQRHFFSILGLLFIYLLLTIIRSLRDDFGVEIWQELGVDGKPEVFAQSEFYVMIGVVIVNGLAIMVKNNRMAFLAGLGLTAVGYSVVLASVFGLSGGGLSPMAYMVLLGLGLYIPYVAFHTTIFERFIAASREIGTTSYLLYLADAFGYLAYVAIMFFRNRATGDLEFLPLLQFSSIAVAVVSILITVMLVVFYMGKLPKESVSVATEEGA